MKEDKRFEIIQKEGLGFSREVVLLRDKQTGVQYLFLQSSYAGGLTPLLDKEGKPVVERHGY